MRRTISAILASGALLLAMSLAAPVAAQDQPMADHPIVGAWLLHPFPNDPTQVSLMVFESSGTLVTTDSQGTTGLGAWTATDSSSVDLTFEEAAIGPDGSYQGVVTIRASGEVSEDGQSFSGTWTIELPAAMATALGAPAGELGPGDVTGERLGVQPMGQTVGPMPAPPQAAPSPEASPAS